MPALIKLTVTPIIICPWGPVLPVSLMPILLTWIVGLPKFPCIFIIGPRFLLSVPPNPWLLPTRTATIILFREQSAARRTAKKLVLFPVCVRMFWRSWALKRAALSRRYPLNSSPRKSERTAGAACGDVGWGSAGGGDAAAAAPLAGAPTGLLEGVDGGSVLGASLVLGRPERCRDANGAGSSRSCLARVRADWSYTNRSSSLTSNCGIVSPLFLRKWCQTSNLLKESGAGYCWRGEVLNTSSNFDNPSSDS